jgi:hypothetical protein
MRITLLGAAAVAGVFVLVVLILKRHSGSSKESQNRSQ